LVEVQREGAARAFECAFIEGATVRVAVNLALGESLEIHDATEEDGGKGHRDDHGLGEQGPEFDFSYVFTAQEVRRDEEYAKLASTKGGFDIAVPVFAGEEVGVHPTFEFVLGGGGELGKKDFVEALHVIVIGVGVGKEVARWSHFEFRLLLFGMAYKAKVIEINEVSTIWSPAFERRRTVYWGVPLTSAKSPI